MSQELPAPLPAAQTPDLAPNQGPSINPKFLLGLLHGAGTLGGGVGLATNLMRQRNALLEDAQDDEDDALTVPVLRRAKKAGVDEPLWASALALPGRIANKLSPPAAAVADQRHLGLLDLMLGGTIAPAAFLGGLQLARGGYNSIRRRDLRQSLQDEQAKFEQLLSQEAEQDKSASVKQAAMPTTGQIAGMAVLGMLPLTSITAAMLTRAQLEKSMPSTRVAVDPRMRLRAATEAPAKEVDDEDEDELQAKAASLLINAALSFSSDSGLRGLCGAAMCGLLPAAEESMCKSASAEDTLVLTDAAGVHYTTCRSQAVKLAAVKAVASSALGPMATKLAALELAERMPTLLQDPRLDAMDYQTAVKFAAAVWDIGAWSAVQQQPDEAAQAEKLASAGWNNWSRLRQRQLGQTGEHGTQGAEFSVDSQEDTSTSADPIDEFMATSQVMRPQK